MVCEGGCHRQRLGEMEGPAILPNSLIVDLPVPEVLKEAILNTGWPPAPHQMLLGRSLWRVFCNEGFDQRLVFFPILPRKHRVARQDAMPSVESWDGSSRSMI